MDTLSVWNRCDAPLFLDQPSRVGGTLPDHHAFTATYPGLLAALCSPLALGNGCPLLGFVPGTMARPRAAEPDRQSLLFALPRFQPAVGILSFESFFHRPRFLLVFLSANAVGLPPPQMVLAVYFSCPDFFRAEPLDAGILLFPRTYTAVHYFCLSPARNVPTKATRLAAAAGANLCKMDSLSCDMAGRRVLSRLLFSNLAYKNSLLTDLRTQPLSAVPALIGAVFSDLWLVSVKAWLQIFQFPDLSVGGPVTLVFFASIVLIIGLIVILGLGRIRTDEPQSIKARALWPIGLGFAAMLLAGGPYWLAKLELTLGFPASRFTISFILGVSLLLAGLLELFPARYRIVIVVFLVALAGGRQALSANSFRRDWITQKDMFWQMSWRAPGLVPNTTVLMNQGPLNYYADNSLAAALNWIYDPDNRTTNIHYVFFFPTSRVSTGTMPGFTPGLPINYNYLIGKFSGNTSQTVAFYYEPPGCLRLLDPQINSQNRLIPDSTFLRDAASLSSSEWILAEGTARLPAVYSPEPVHGWCYYFEQADLARQMGDWDTRGQFGR